MIVLDGRVYKLIFGLFFMVIYDRRQFTKLAGVALGSLALARVVFGNGNKDTDAYAKRQDEENLLDNYMRNVVSLDDIDFSDLPDPAFVRGKDERQKYISSLKDIVVEKIKASSGDSVADVVAKAPFVYDSSGADAIARQSEEFAKDEEYFRKNRSIKLVMGGFSGSYDEFMDMRKKDMKDQAQVLLRNIRAMIPFSLSSVGIGEIYPAYFFPHFFDELSSLERTNLTANEKKIISLGSSLHETAHILYNYSGPFLKGERINKNNASRLLNLSESETSGILGLVSEGYGTQYQEDFLRLANVSDAGSCGFRKKVSTELARIVRRYPALSDLTPKIRL